MNLPKKQRKAPYTFCAAFFDKFMQQFVLHRKFSICFALRVLADLSNNLSSALYKKFSLCFALRFLANLSNNLSYVLCRKFPICFAQRFLANLSNNLSYIVYRKFLICFALYFLATLSNRGGGFLFCGTTNKKFQKFREFDFEDFHPRLF